MFSDERPPPNLNPNDPRSPLWLEPTVLKDHGFWPKRAPPFAQDDPAPEPSSPLLVYATVAAFCALAGVIVFTTL